MSEIRHHEDEVTGPGQVGRGRFNCLRCFGRGWYWKSEEPEEVELVPGMSVTVSSVRQYRARCCCVR